MKTPASEIEKQIEELFLDFFNKMGYDDVLVEIDHMDHFTNQLFITSVGNWPNERRQLLQQHLKQGFRKIGVSDLSYENGKEWQ